MRLQILIISLLIGILGFYGCKDLGNSHNILTNHNVDMKGVMHGKKVYKGAKNCTACHGTNLNGNGYIVGCYNCHDALWEKTGHDTARSAGAYTNVMHKSGAVQAATNCIECHASSLGATDLTGSLSRPSCYECHTDNWTALSIHTETKGGYLHGVGSSTPTTNCATCHNTDSAVSNGNAPGCYSCHGAVWNKVNHTDFKDGVGHGIDKDNPTVDCVACHGANLTGGTIATSSCYKCHGAEWND